LADESPMRREEKAKSVSKPAVSRALEASDRPWSVAPIGEQDSSSAFVCCWLAPIGGPLQFQALLPCCTQLLFLADWNASRSIIDSC
jgi:hypothetical protein